VKARANKSTDDVPETRRAPARLADRAAERVGRAKPQVGRDVEVLVEGRRSGPGWCRQVARLPHRRSRTRGGGRPRHGPHRGRRRPTRSPAEGARSHEPASSPASSAPSRSAGPLRPGPPTACSFVGFAPSPGAASPLRGRARSTAGLRRARRHPVGAIDPAGKRSALLMAGLLWLASRGAGDCHLEIRKSGDFRVGRRDVGGRIRHGTRLGRHRPAPDSG
jgi:hypothetical protein